MHASRDANDGLAGMVHTVSRAAVVVGTLATFVPALIFLGAQWRAVTIVDALIVTVPVIVTGAAWLWLAPPTRVLITVIAAYGMFIAQFELTSPQGPTWPPIASATFAVIVIAVGGLGTRLAICAIITSALLCYVGVRYFPNNLTLISTDLLGGWITPLVDVALGVSFLVLLTSWRASSRRFDAEMSEIWALAERAQLEEEVDHARRAVDRRLHETVLNTLLVLCTSSDRLSAREQARRDLVTLDRIQARTSTQLSVLVVDAAASVPGVRVRVAMKGDASMPDARSSSILRDALVELLRNIEQHSGTDSAELTAEVSTTTVRLTLTDFGSGMPDEPSARFGTRQTVERSLRSIGGDVSWSASHPHGVTVHLDVPLADRMPQALTRSSLSILLESRWARAAMFPTVAVGVIALPAAVRGFEHAGAIGLSFALQALCAVVLILRTHGTAFGIARIGVLASAVLTMVAAASFTPTCATAVGLHWIIFPAAGGIVLGVLSLRSWAARTAAILAVVGVSVFVSVQYPPECMIDPLDAALENAVWVLVFVGIVAWLSRAADRRHSEAEVELATASRHRAANAAAQAATMRWRVVSPTTRALLERVARDEEVAGSEAVRRVARQEETALRSILELGMVQAQPTREYWEDITSRARERGIELTLRVSGPAPTDVPEGLRSGITALLKECAGGAIEVTLLAHSCLVTLHCTQAIHLQPPWRLLDVRQDSSRVLEWPAPEAP